MILNFFLTVKFSKILLHVYFQLAMIMALIAKTNFKCITLNVYKF